MLWTWRLVGLALAVAAAGCASSDDDLSCRGFRFNHQAWVARSSLVGSPSPRQRIADHIVGCRTLHGKRYSDIRKLLGRPDEEGAAYADGRRDLAYLIGDERGPFKVDSEWLDLQFRKGRLIEATIGS